MRRLAVFVDAGYFWAQTIQAIFGKKSDRRQVAMDYPALRALLLETAEREFADTSILRIYWYDGPGNNGKASEHKDIESLDDFKLRMGTRNSLGQQKAVDGLIIADLISLAQNKAITEALIVSGDADLTPGVVAAQGLGLRVHLLSLGAKEATSPYLKAEVDRKCRWSEWDIFRYASAYIPAVTSVGQAGRPPAQTVPEAQATQPHIGPSQTEGPSVQGETVNALKEPTPLPQQARTEQPERQTVLLTAESTQLVQDEILRRIASTCFERLTREEREEAKAGRSLPPEVDRKLLFLARRQFGTLIEEQDRRTLRDIFKELVRSDKSSAP